MPHSTGGGHSSSSSHSSSHSSSSYHSSSSHSSHSSSSSRSGGFRDDNREPSMPTGIHREHYPGSTRYYYRPFYGFGRPRYVYCDRDLTKRKHGSFIGIFAYLIFFAAIAICIYWSVMPQRVDSDGYGDPQIADWADVIDDTDMLTEALENFREETGIIPVIVTVNESDWTDDYSDLDDVAWDMYVNNFDDEYHWVITLSMEDDSLTGACDFQGVRGDYTDDVLTTDRIADFNSKFEDNLGDYRIDEAFARSLDELRREMTSIHIRGNYVLYTLSFIMLMYMIFGVNKFILPRKYYYAE